MCILSLEPVDHCDLYPSWAKDAQPKQLVMASFRRDDCERHVIPPSCLPQVPQTECERPGAKMVDWLIKLLQNLSNMHAL